MPSRYITYLRRGDANIGIDATQLHEMIFFMHINIFLVDRIGFEPCLQLMRLTSYHLLHQRNINYI